MIKTVLSETNAPMSSDSASTTSEEYQMSFPDITSWEDVPKLNHSPDNETNRESQSPAASSMNSTPAPAFLETDVQYALKYLETVHPEQLQELIAKDIYGKAPSSDKIHMKNNAKSKNILNLCEPYLQQERNRCKRQGRDDSGGDIDTFRYKTTTQFVNKRKDLLLFYYNALVEWVKDQRVVAETISQKEFLNDILTDSIDSCDFFDRMILTIAFVWKRLTSGQQTEQEAPGAASRQSVEELREDVEDIREDIQNHHFSHSADMRDVRDRIEALALRVEGVDPRGDDARKKPRGYHESASHVSVAAPLTTSVLPRAPDGYSFSDGNNVTDDEVLGILRRGGGPMKALDVRNAWFKLKGKTKETTPVAMHSTTAYNKVLYGLKKKGQVELDSSSGGPKWSLMFLSSATTCSGAISTHYDDSASTTTTTTYSWGEV
jgi:hypothetical protein